MKVILNVYTIDNHPNPQKVYDWIRDNWHDLNQHDVDDLVRSIKELSNVIGGTHDYSLSQVPDRGQHITFKDYDQDILDKLDAPSDPLTGMRWDCMLIEGLRNGNTRGVMDTLHDATEHTYKDEALKELCIANNYIFYENGKFFYLRDGMLVLDEDPVAAAAEDALADIEKVCKAREETWETKANLVLQTSYGVKDTNDGCTISVTVGIKECGTRGYFELYDVNNVDNWYAEGGLSFEGNKLVDYDGVFELSSFVEDKLKEWGYEIDL